MLSWHWAEKEEGGGRRTGPQLGPREGRNLVGWSEERKIKKEEEEGGDRLGQVDFGPYWIFGVLFFFSFLNSDSNSNLFSNFIDLN